MHDDEGERDDGGGVFRLRLLPSAPGVRHLVHAHLEAHDHLAVATDMPDGSLEISGPASRCDEIAAVVAEISRACGLLSVARV